MKLEKASLAGLPGRQRRGITFEQGTNWPVLGYNLGLLVGEKKLDQHNEAAYGTENSYERQTTGC